MGERSAACSATPSPLTGEGWDGGENIASTGLRASDGPTLVIDAGSSGIRARIVRDDGRVVAGASRPYAYASETDAGDLARAFDLRGCRSALVDAVNEALASGIAPSAIAVTSQRQSLVFLDGDGRALYAGPNTDLRAVFQGAALDAEHGDSIYRTTGHRPAFMMASGKLAWLRDTRPDDYARVSHILPLADWIAWRLTGVAGCEPSLAAASGMLDIRTRRWASSLFAELGLRLPETPLREASEPRGAVVADNLPSTPSPFTGEGWDGGEIPTITNPSALVDALAGLPVKVAGADTQCALIGMGIDARGGEGQAGIVAGWSATVQIAMSHPAVSEGMKTWTGLFPSSGLGGGLWTLESGAGDVGNAWRWLAGTLFGERALADAYAEMDRLAASVPRGAGGVSVDLGAGTMDVSALGMRRGGIAFPVPLTLGGPTRAQICRAALESFAYAIRANLEQAERESGIATTRIAFGGGMTRSTTLCRILPNALGRPVTVFAESDPTAAGAAGTRAHGGIEVQPSAQAAAEYERLYGEWASAGV